MSYSVTIELSPHADPAKTIAVLCRNAEGRDTLMGALHEVRPKIIVSVPPGNVLILADQGQEPAETLFPKRPEWAKAR